MNMDTTNCCLLLLMQLLSLLVIPAGTQYKTPAFICDLVCVLSQADLRTLAFIVAVALNRFVFQCWQGNLHSSRQSSTARDKESQKIRLMFATDACYTRACSTLLLPDSETWQFCKNHFLQNVTNIYRGNDTAALFMLLLRFIPFYFSNKIMDTQRESNTHSSCFIHHLHLAHPGNRYLCTCWKKIDTTLSTIFKRKLFGWIYRESYRVRVLRAEGMPK